MTLAETLQDDFGFGIFRGRKSPANAVYDAVNAFVDDEGNLFKRGGSAFYSASNASITLSWHRGAVFAGGADGSGGRLEHVRSRARRWLGAGLAYARDPAGSRPVVLAGYLIFPHVSIPGQLNYYAGSLKATTTRRARRA